MAGRFPRQGSSSVPPRSLPPGFFVGHKTPSLDTACSGCTVEITVGGLNQPCRGTCPADTSAFGAEAVKRGQGTASHDFVDRAATIAKAALVINPSIISRPIEAAIAGLNEPSRRASAIRAPDLSAEVV
jgi:hypothetical protein